MEKSEDQKPFLFREHLLRIEFDPSRTVIARTALNLLKIRQFENYTGCAKDVFASGSELMDKDERFKAYTKVFNTFVLLLLHADRFSNELVERIKAVLSEFLPDGSGSFRSYMESSFAMEAVNVYDPDKVTRPQDKMYAVMKAVQHLYQAECFVMLSKGGLLSMDDIQTVAYRYLFDSGCDMDTFRFSLEHEPSPHARITAAGETRETIIRVFTGESITSLTVTYRYA